MPKLRELLQERVRGISEDASKMDMVRNWIDGGYYGKVINFRSLDSKESYHVVLTREGVELREGDYPSVEFSYQGDEETLLSVLNKEADASSSVKAGRLEVRGSLNEAIAFQRLL